MSQFALGLRANVSARHVSFIESGRARPSRRTTLALANALGIPLRERNVLLEAAGHARAYAESGLDGTEREHLRRAVDFVLQRFEPYFAVAIDRYWDIRAYNRAAEPVLARCFGVLNAREARPANLLRLMLDERCLRPSILNWPDIATVLLSALRAQAAERPSDGRLMSLLEEMEQLAAIAGVEGLTTDRPDTPALPLRLRVDGNEVRLFGIIMAFATPLDAAIEELRIETFYPADAESEAVLRSNGATSRSQLDESDGAHPGPRSW